MNNASNTGQADQTYKWKIDSAVTPTDYKPTHDQDQNGYFVWADSSPGSFHDHTELYTAVIGNTGPQCELSFYYWMQGSAAGILHVFTKTKGAYAHLMAIEGDHGPAWKPANIFIGARQGFQVIIQARRGISYRGDISIDTVQFLHCQPPQNNSALCGLGTFACSNGYCIDPDKVCDYANDCGDGSDEYALASSTNPVSITVTFLLNCW